MDEFKFVLKCLLISCVIVIFSQTRISGETLENKAFIFFKHSDTAHWVRAAADGGVKLIREGVTKTQNFISDKFGDSVSGLSSGSYRRSEPVPAGQASANTGLFRKLEKKEKTQQLGETAESDYNEDEITEE